MDIFPRPIPKPDDEHFLFENNYSVIESWGVVIADKIWDEGDIFPI